MLRLLYVPGSRPSASYSSYNPPNSLKRKCHYYFTLQLRKTDMQRRQQSKEEALKTGSMKIQGSNDDNHVSCPPSNHHQQQPSQLLDGWLQNKIFKSTQRKGKSPRPEGIVSSLPKNGLFRHWHPANSSFTEVPMLL